MFCLFVLAAGVAVVCSTPYSGFAEEIKKSNTKFDNYTSLVDAAGSAIARSSRDNDYFIDSKGKLVQEAMVKTDADKLFNTANFLAAAYSQGGEDSLASISGSVNAKHDETKGKIREHKLKKIRKGYKTHDDYYYPEEYKKGYDYKSYDEYDYKKYEDYYPNYQYDQKKYYYYDDDKIYVPRFKKDHYYEDNIKRYEDHKPEHTDDKYYYKKDYKPEYKNEYYPKEYEKDLEYRYHPKKYQYQPEYKYPKDDYYPKDPYYYYMP